MTWTNTHTGKKIFLLDLTPEMVRLEDLAHALAGTMRYRAQTWLSVAQHSVAVLAVVERLTGPLSKRDARYVLFHDGGEAYSWDVPAPVKGDEKFAALVAMEERAQACVYEAFGVVVADVPEQVKSALKYADALVRAVERRFFDATHADWKFEEVPKQLLGVLNQVYLAEWEPRRAKKVFLDLARKTLED